MGLCGSTPNESGITPSQERVLNQQVEAEMKQQKALESNIMKLLLLGAGGSGQFFILIYVLYF
jgi:hypothetical protein